jgi:hypothetical protein
MHENEKAGKPVPLALSSDIRPVMPAHDLTPAGHALLEVVVDPITRTMSVTDICDLAGISRDSYYRLFRQESFVRAYLDACKVFGVAAAMPTIQSVAKSAIDGDMMAAKLILEMSGLHQPTARVEHTHTHEAGPSLKEILSRRQA